jgi:hypothetical protein
MSLLLAEHQVNDPATANVWVIGSTMIQDVLVLTSGVLEGVAEDRHG